MAHPRRLGALVLGLAVALSVLSVAHPSVATHPTAGLPAATTISGFPQMTKQVTRRQKVHFKVKVNDRTTARRSVRLQQKIAGQWRTKVRGLTNARGRTRLVWRAPKKAGATRLRVAVPRSGRSVGAITPVRKVVISRSAGKPTKAERYEARVFELLNEARSEPRTCGFLRYPAVGKLERHAKLDRAARKFAHHMADEKFFDHISPNGDTPTTRARAEGYLRGVGENIAAGYAKPGAVMNGWLSSPGHCANLMRGGYIHVGLGFAIPREGRSAPFSDYWVQDFG
ncbi:hypothetical protein GCM10027020_19890 [Nocardioides salsibiostraticola]